jgi:predicted N-acyltransferase
MSAAAFDVAPAGSIQAVSPSVWDALTGADSLYLSHRWLSAVEREPGADADLLLATEAGGLLGALPVYAVTAEANDDYRRVTALGGAGQGHHLVTGTRRAYVNDFLLDPELSTERGDEVLDALLSAAQRYATERGRAGICLLYLRTGAAARLRRLRGDACPLLVDIETDLARPGERFEDYLAAVGGRRAYAVRKEMRRFAAAGYEVGVERLAECWHEAGPLVAQVQQKYGHPDTPDVCRAALRGLAESFGPQSVVFTARRAARLLACAVFFAWRGTLYGRAVGFAYDELDNTGEYFNLYIYEPLRYAYRNGLSGLHLGRGSNVAKLRRGAWPRALWAVFLPAGGAGARWRAFNRAALSDLRRQADVADLDVPEGWAADAAA